MRPHKAVSHFGSLLFWYQVMVSISALGYATARYPATTTRWWGIHRSTILIGTRSMMKIVFLMALLIVTAMFIFLHVIERNIRKPLGMQLYATKQSQQLKHYTLYHVSWVLGLLRRLAVLSCGWDTHVAFGKRA